MEFLFWRLNQSRGVAGCDKEGKIARPRLRNNRAMARVAGERKLFVDETLFRNWRLLSHEATSHSGSPPSGTSNILDRIIHSISGEVLCFTITDGSGASRGSIRRHILTAKQSRCFTASDAIMRAVFLISLSQRPSGLSSSCSVDRNSILRKCSSAVERQSNTAQVMSSCHSAIS